VTQQQVRVRFCPSPTGNPHVGLIRTALFNWAYARHTGGTFVFRIEDTDAARDSQESYEALLDSLRWLGMDWDEGPEIGGPFAPYRQSERSDIYRDVIARLTEAGYLYESFATPEETEERHRAAGRDPKLGYDGFDRDLTEEQKATYREQGRQPVLRLRMPEEDITWNDLVRGEVTFAAGTVPDYVLVRADGNPLYTLVNPVDDALMQITHVLRGEDLLSSTPRQIALYRALIAVGVAKDVPQFGHLPYVMGEGNKKLSKRDPQSALNVYREEGYLPEGLLNYLALLGWSIADDHDLFSMAEMIEAFDVTKVKANPARFDSKKCESINASHMRMLTPEDFAHRLEGFIRAKGIDSDSEVIAKAAPLVQERATTLADAFGLLRFLFIDGEVPIEEKAATKLQGETSRSAIEAAVRALTALPDWTTEAIDTALKTALVDELGLKPRDAFTPVRVAVTGRTVSPPLFESLELLGKEVSLQRLTRVG